jgi:nitroreductase
MNSIFHRTSVRNYLDKPVEQEKIIKMLKAAMAAPSAGNQQPWEYYVITGENKLEQLSQSSPYAGCTKKAPFAFVPCYKKDIKFPEYAQIDLSASVENLLLEADELGLGAVWLGIAPVAERMEYVKNILEIPENLEVFAIIPCGYPVKENLQQNRYDETRIHYIHD